MKNSNKGFSLIELIIVVAIMAVLVGVMAPQYIKYVERTEKTRDCAAIGTVLDACEIIGLDPDISWGSGDANKITIVIGTGGTTYTGGAHNDLDEYVPAANVVLQANDWGPFTINAVKADTGAVTFDIADAQKTVLGKYSQTLSERLE